MIKDYENIWHIDYRGRVNIYFTEILVLENHQVRLVRLDSLG